MMRRLLFLACFTVGACDNDQAGQSASIRALEARVATLESRTDRSDEKLLRHIIDEMPNSAWLRQSDGGYSYLKTELGSLSFRLKEIHSSGQGSRVDITIGNPTSARITKLFLTGEWGQLDAEGAPDLNTSKDFESSVTGTLEPGSWNEVQFVIDAAKPSELGYIRIKTAEPQSMTLNNN